MRNLVTPDRHVDPESRWLQNGHKGACVWFSGLSGSGKSTTAAAVEEVLHNQRRQVYVLDGDQFRQGLCRDLGFSREDRSENIRRVGETARIMVDAGMIVLAAFISPFQQDRKIVRALFPEGTFFEVWMNTSLELCEKRDIKGLYQLARQGQIKHFTGISSPYEVPLDPELTLTGEGDQLPANTRKVVQMLREADLFFPDQP